MKEFKLGQILSQIDCGVAQVVSVIPGPEICNGQEGTFIQPFTAFIAPTNGVDSLEALNKFGEEILSDQSNVNRSSQCAREVDGKLRFGSLSAFERTSEQDFNRLTIMLLPNVEVALQESQAYVERINR